jgi:hypothetical protein
MLVQPDKMELGDKRLNPDEAVAEQREMALRQASRFRISGQAELEDPDRATGSQMAWQEVIRRLQRCNPAIRVKDGIPGNVAIYIPKKHGEYHESDFADPPEDEFFLHHRYITGFPKQPLSEYSYVDLDTSLLPTREHRGWRSVLIALIKAGAIKYRDSIREFGNPELDQRSGRWFQQVSKFNR